MALIGEQYSFDPSRTRFALTRSAEDSSASFDENGGVKEVPITGERAVLTDAMARRLAVAAQRIKRLFGVRIRILNGSTSGASST